MKSHPVTIKDIARTLEISISTVSRALKDHPDISPATKNMVKAFAEKVHYRPNALALSLRQSKTFTIGVIIPEIVHHFFSSVISGIEEIAYASGYKVIICQSNESEEREKIVLQALVDSRVDGVMVSLSKNTLDYSHFKSVLEDELPVVFFDRICSDLSTDRVVADDFEGARIATNHLLNISRDRILHLAGPQNLLIGTNRKEGYIQALKQRSVEVNPDFILPCDSREMTLELADKILALAPHINGVFAVNDTTAITVMQILQKNGYKIPQDIAVVGFGDGPNADIAYPSLTTVEQKGYEIGREACRLLLYRLANADKSDFTTTVLTPELKLRDSTFVL